MDGKLGGHCDESCRRVHERFTWKSDSRAVSPGPSVRVYVCCSEDMGDDPNKWYLSRLDDLCRGEKLEQSCGAESEGAC